MRKPQQHWHTIALHARGEVVVGYIRARQQHRVTSYQFVVRQPVSLHRIRNLSFQTITLSNPMGPAQTTRQPWAHGEPFSDVFFARPGISASMALSASSSVAMRRVPQLFQLSLAKDP